MTFCPEKTRADLEWDRLLSALAARCRSPLGKDEALSLPFPETHDASRRALQEAKEAADLLRLNEPLPVGDVPDVREALGRLRVGGVLSGPELRGVASMLATARTLRRYLNSRRSRSPALFEAFATDPSLDDVAEEIEGSFDPGGTLADHASPRLRELRSEYQTARSRLIARLEELMKRYEGIVQERFVTEREGRYVIPIRADAHERFPGLVHATSASGATLFVEPRVVIPMGNRLKMLEAEVAREELAVYTRLSSLVSDVLPSAEAAAQALAVADVRAATARLAEEIGLDFPIVVEEPVLDLSGARHPLLALDLPKVVASDMAIARGQAMVISGPNAGGKTVALKTLGLVALMVRAGLPVPCAPESRVGLFDVVLTDVGDDQSLQKNLSTFSAHIRNLVSVLDETRPGALVLLDELAGGTDPREGEALAAGLLDSLCARGGAVAITTHYEGLKALALADPRFVNASVGFDLEALKPTYALVMGVPGSSSALAVARQYGIPSTVLERAERFLHREDRNFEAIVQKLHGERAALELARQAAEAREEEARRAAAGLEADRQALKDKERAMLSQEAEALLGRLQRAKEELRAAHAKLRGKKVDEAAAREASRAIDKVAAQVAIGGELEPLLQRKSEPPREPVGNDTLKKGAKVYVPRLRAEAEIVEVLASGQVRVAAGALKLVVAANELQAAAAPEPARKTPSTKSGAREPVGLEAPIQTSDNTCDVRGLRMDDALPMTQTFLDRALNGGLRFVFIVHGHGTGALRDGIRKELKSSPYVRFFRAGENNEGGDGVTIAWLA